MIAIQGENRRRPHWQLLAKRALDYGGAGLGVLLLVPVLLLIALLIRLDSPGPVFFRQERKGLGGRLFRVWKFRSMEVNAEARLKDLEALNESEGGVLFKLKCDPRVTRTGRILRSTSLDELPQLLNVLQGHMSLVGPRPLQLRDCERALEYDREAFERRSMVLPGITGPWQVAGRSALSFEQMLKLDGDYIEHWSFALDLSILLRTLLVVLKRSGAY
ncbi:MAG: sugar transferase [Aphanocapsa lilacina HA4352-LM1]|jgi:lipopolysaccharide/colanic/teichoic acid biosynthesis glycosyltransferase|nr:sugar transferase [Aphanocapsa lilacina HA4352-LM1]